MTSTTLRRAVKIGPVAAIQMEYSPFVLDVEGPESTNLLATCRELGVSIICYSPLGRGLLTTTFSNNDLAKDSQDFREMAFPRFQAHNREANVKLVKQFRAIAEKKGCTTSQLALAWLLKQGPDILPIPGTKRIKYLEENLGALEVDLSDVEEREIRDFVQKAQVQGHRNPASHTESLVDTVEEVL